MLELIRSVSHGKGVNVLVSSHVLPDIERVCDRVIVVMGGQLRADGTIRDLKRIEGHPVDVELRELAPAFVEVLVAKGASVDPPKGTTYRVKASGIPSEVAHLVMRAAKESGAQVRGFQIAERSLEEAFLEAVRA